MLLINHQPNKMDRLEKYINSLGEEICQLDLSRGIIIRFSPDVAIQTINLIFLHINRWKIFTIAYNPEENYLYLTL